MMAIAAKCFDLMTQKYDTDSHSNFDAKRAAPKASALPELSHLRGPNIAEYSRNKFADKCALSTQFCDGR